MNNKYYFVLVEIVSFIIYTQIVYSYVWYIYGDLSIFDAGVVTFIVAPILSSITSSYRYELKYHVFIENKILIKSCFYLYFPHVIFSGIGVYIFDDISDWTNFLLDSIVVATIQVLFIFLSIKMFGKYVNNTLLKQ